MILPPPPLAALLHHLGQGRALVASLAQADFTTPVQAVYGATIGTQYRHCLDHYAALLTPDDAVLDYDQRPRDPALEQDPVLALARTHELHDRLASRPAAWLDHPVQVRELLADGTPGEAKSTRAREVLFVISHVVHHHALIGVMCHLLGKPMPAGFGIASSTLAHRQRTAQG